MIGNNPTKNGVERMRKLLVLSVVVMSISGSVLAGPRVQQHNKVEKNIVSHRGSAFVPPANSTPGGAGRFWAHPSANSCPGSSSPCDTCTPASPDPRLCCCYQADGSN